jgi:predicted metal-dependent hydrolase
MAFWRKSKPQNENGIVAIGGEDVAFSVTRSRKRKRTIAFKMERDKTLTVLAPASASLGALTRILQQRAAWITQQLMRTESAPQNTFHDGGAITYLGHRYRLHVTRNNTKSSCRLSPHAFHINIPHADLSPQNLQQEIRLELTLWIKKRAKHKLKKRCDLWAQKMGVAYNKILVTNPKSRWGSCSADNIIRLNYRLMLAPLPLIDYVVAHELAHIPHKNHSVRFWGFVGRFMPDYPLRRQQLRRIESTLKL